MQAVRRCRLDLQTGLVLVAYQDLFLVYLRNPHPADRHIDIKRSGGPRPYVANHRQRKLSGYIDFLINAVSQL